MIPDYFLPVIFLLAFTGCAAPPKKENKQQSATDTSVFDITQRHQVLLTHEAHFKKHTSLYGASAFLLHYRGGIYAVTARHLIGSAGGVEPEIKPADLNRFFEKWRLFPRVPVYPATDTVIVAKTILNYDSLAHDILLLPTVPSHASAVALQPQFSLPEKGEPLFIIGCPYSESDCRQNVYPVTYVNFDTTDGSLVCMSDVRFNLSGFSGAPLVTYSGKVVGVVTASTASEHFFYIYATAIRSIREIK